MPQGPAPAGSGREENPAREPREPVHTPDWMNGEDWQAWCDSQRDQDEPSDPDEEEPDPDGLPGSWGYDLDAIVADCRRISAEEAAAYARAARLGLAGGQPVGLGRRGPGEPGSARRAPGEYLSGRPGSPPGCCWTRCRGVTRWPGSPPGRPGTTTPTTAPATMRWPGRSPPGTGSRRTPRPA